MPSSTAKADDRVVVGLNACGLSHAGIGRRLGIHPTTVAHRLKVLGVSSTDTRRAFMEEIFESLTLDQQLWLLERIGAGTRVQDLIRDLLVQGYASAKTRAGVS